jgi:peroxiredoxin
MMNRWTWVFAALLVAGPVWLWASRVPAEARTVNLDPDPAVGRPAPDFTLTTLDGQPFRLSDLRGTPVVINFWATWCGPCRNEMPSLQAAATRFDGEIVVVGVDQGEDAATVQAFVDELGVRFPIALDTEMAVGARYNVKGLPITYFVDAEGMIRHLWVGEMNSVILAEGIAKVWP